MIERPRHAQSCRGWLGNPLQELKGLSNDHRHVFEEMLQAEESFAHDWACFYHSYNHPALVYEVQAAIAKVRFGFAAERGALPRLLRHPFEKLPDASAVLSAFPKWLDRDHNIAFKSVGICCSTSLVCQDPEATPLHVFSDGYCASRVDTKNIVEKLLQAFGVPEYALSDVVENIWDAAARSFLPQVTNTGFPGHLLQIFIHRSYVDRLAYASLPFGVLDATRHPLSKSLSSPNRVVGQARLVVNPIDFLDGHKVRMFTYSADSSFRSTRSCFQDCLCQILHYYVEGSGPEWSYYDYDEEMHIGQAGIQDLCFCIANSADWEADVLGDVQAALKEAGYTDETLPTALKDSGYSASDLNRLGYSAGALKQAGYTLGALVDAGYQDVEILGACFTDAEVLSAGFSASVLKTAGYLASTLKEAGYSARTLVKARYTPETIIAAGYANSDLLNAGFAASDLIENGFSVAGLRGAGYTDDALIIAGCSLKELHLAGCPVLTLRKAGYSARALREAGYTAIALQQASYSKSDILLAGYAVEALPTLGYSVGDLRKAGYGAAAMQRAGYSATALKMAGYLDSEIFEAEYTDAALLEAGCSPGAHRNIAKDIAALWYRSLAKVGEDIDDTLIDFLTTAALDAEDQSDLVQLLDTYLGECCSDTLGEFLALGLCAS